MACVHKFYHDSLLASTFCGDTPTFPIPTPSDIAMQMTHVSTKGYKRGQLIDETVVLNFGTLLDNFMS